MTISMPGPPDIAELARRFDHTFLKPEATEADVRRLCREAAEYGFYAVCVNPTWAPLAAAALDGTPVLVCAVAGFPLGASRPAIKAAEAALAVREGAAEIDMVLDLGRLISDDLVAVADDIGAVRDALPHGVILKVIVESALLTDAQKREAAAIVRDSGAQFIKTSTGFHAAGGATVVDVALLRSLVGDGVRVKASGGIRDLASTLVMLDAGADRIGASAGVAILAEARARVQG